MSKNFPVKADLSRWMDAVENVDGLDALYLGEVVGDANLLAVVIKNGTRFFCKTHRRIFHPLAVCPDCSNLAIPETPPR